MVENLDKFKMYDYNKLYTDNGFYIPSRMMEGIKRYVDKGVVPGQFLQAIIKNDLNGAVAHADQENLQNIPAYVRFFYNNTPGPCSGSPAKMKAWVEKNEKERENAQMDTANEEG